jgi:hypothetical protein
MDFVTEAQPSLSYHDFFQYFTLLIIQVMSRSVLLALLRCVRE